MAKQKLHFVLQFSKISKRDIAHAGGKGCNLGELYNQKFNVPNGFVVTTAAYYDFVEFRKLKDKISKELEKLNINDHALLEKISGNIKKLIHDEEIMEHLVKEINAAVKKSSGNKFAVRSSATAEDLITASFAGQQDTYLNVSRAKIVENVKRCWASLFNARAIFYRHEKNIPHDVGMAVVVQEMVPAEFAGVMFTVDPIKKKYILIEGAFGLGEQVVSGEVTPNSYMLDRKSLKILEKNESLKEYDENIIKDIAKQGLLIEKHYKIPMDIEFAVKSRKIYILQSRAITAL